MKKIIALSAVLIALTGCQVEGDDSTTQIPLGDGSGVEQKDFTATLTIPKEMTAGTPGDPSTYAEISVSDFTEGFEGEVYLSSSGELDGTETRFNSFACTENRDCFDQPKLTDYCEYKISDRRTWCTDGDTTAPQGGVRDGWIDTGDINSGNTYIILEVCRASPLIGTENCTSTKGIINLY